MHLGRFVYAFGAGGNRWGVLELPEGVSARPIVNNDSIVVEYGTQIHTFRAGSGEWEHVDARDLIDVPEDDEEHDDDPSP